jgi:hypothetical protein
MISRQHLPQGTLQKYMITISETASIICIISLFQIADELNAMDHSLQTLKGISEFASHRKNLENLQERLEGLTRPQLLQAFNSHEIGE